MEQEKLWFDTPEEALRAPVRAIGPKEVASKFFPDMPIERALTRLDDCLNPDKRDKLSPGQIMLILKWGRAAECHTAMHFLNTESGYSPPVPVDPETEHARREREFIDSVNRLEKLADQLTRDRSVVTKLRAAS